MNGSDVERTAGPQPGPALPDGANDGTIEEVWREFSDDLRQFIGRRVSRPHDADDILQLVALRLTQHPLDGRDRRTVLGWLYTVTRNAITDHYRAAVHRREVTTADVPDALTADLSDEDDAAQALAGLASCVRPLLRLLPQDQAAAVRLVDLDGVSQVDAARAAGLTVSGMKSRVQRGRKALQSAITACCQLQLDARGAVQDVQPRSGAGCACAA